MEKSELISLFRLRIAVYKVGCEKGLWPNLEDNAAKEYMQYLFPKSSNIALFNLMTNIVQKKHTEYVPADQYNLFHCPIQLDEDIMSYLKTNSDEGVWEFPEGALAYIQSQATVECDDAMKAVYIGKLTDNLSDMVHVIAFHYNNIFTTGCESYPYFN